MLADALQQSSAEGPTRLSWSRWSELPALFAEWGFTRGAEIGVEEGRYSQRLCERVPGLHLLSVDAWQAYQGYRDHVSQAKLDGFYATAMARLASFSATVVRAFSADAALRVPDGSLDFVYLDGNHTLPQVIADLAAWEPKVRAGGVVAGHDYGRRSVGHVQEAVEAWTRAYAVAPWFVLTGDKSPSWMWVKA
jgi:hypothetical protein